MRDFSKGYIAAYPPGWFVKSQYGSWIVADWARANCIECKAPATEHFFFVSRCEPCATVFRDKRHQQELAKLREELERQKRHVCGEEIADAAEFCESCCEHDFDSSEGYHCLNCGKDGSEDVMCAASDAWEGDR